MKKWFAVLCFFLLGVQLLQGQQIILVKGFGKNRRYKFAEGERIKLKLKDSGEVLKGSWYPATAHSLVIGTEEVKLDNIRWIDVSGKENGIYLLRKGKDLLILAGTGYFAFSQLNHLVETGGFSDNRQVQKVSGTLVAGGIICTVLDRAFRRRKVPVGGSRFSISLTEQL